MLLPGIFLQMIGLFVDVDVDIFCIWLSPCFNFRIEFDRLQDCLTLSIVATTEDEGVDVALAWLPICPERNIELVKFSIVTEEVSTTLLNLTSNLQIRLLWCICESVN